LYIFCTDAASLPVDELSEAFTIIRCSILIRELREGVWNIKGSHGRAFQLKRDENNNFE